MCDNPRFHLELSSPADLQVELSSPGADHAVGLELTALQGASAGTPPAKPIATSGNYRKGFALLEVRAVPAGRYLLMASTFEPKREASFFLVVGSSAAVGTKATAHEGDRLERRILRGEWSAANGSAAGCANFGGFHRNPHYRLLLSKRTEVLLRLRLPQQSSGGGRKASLSIDVYRRTDALGADESKRVKPLLASCGGVYSYPPGGALIPRQPLEPGTYVVVLSTYEPFASPYELVAYATDGAMRIDHMTG